MDPATGARLVSRYLDGTASAAEVAALDAALVEDPHLATSFAMAARFEADLRAVHQSAPARPRPSPPAHHGLRRWRIPGGLAAAAVLALGLWAILANLPTRGDPGPVFRTSADEPIPGGTPLAGEILIPDGGMARLAPQAQARAAGTSAHPAVELIAGDVTCQVAPRAPGTSFAVLTPQGQLRVKGTRFQVTVTGETHLGVAEGVVAARCAGQEIDVPAGAFALLDGIRPPTLFLPVVEPALPPPAQWNYRTPGITVDRLAIDGPTGGPAWRLTAATPSAWTAWLHWERGDDWSHLAGLSVVYLGTGSGRTFQVELADNLTQARHPKSVNASERFTATVRDERSGWQEARLPFAAFVRMPNQPAIVPDDGLTLTAVHGVGLAFTGAPVDFTVERIAPYR